MCRSYEARSFLHGGSINISPLRSWAASVESHDLCERSRLKTGCIEVDLTEGKYLSALDLFFRQLSPFLNVTPAVIRRSVHRIDGLFEDLTRSFVVPLPL